jgi:Protein of unknown function (DUF2971)
MSTKSSSSTRNRSVYHYTSAESLIGILQSGKMYATDYRFLNDRTEFNHGRERSKHILKNDIPGGLNLFRREVLKYIDIEDESRTFIVSFSSRKDDLSQWRGYAKDGEGFTLGFSVNFFREISYPKEAPFGFGEVSYLRDSLKRNIRTILDEFENAFESSEKDDACLYEFSSWCEATIAAACSLHKHNSFYLEREWRIVDFFDHKERNRIKVRSRGTSLIPYVEVDLRAEDGKMPLESIGIGPSQTHPFTRDALIDLCNQFGYDVDIYEAKTPYVRL